METNKNSNSIVFILLLGLIAMLPILAIDMYLPSFLEIAKDLNVKPESIQKTLALFTFGFAIGQLLWGPFSDSFGRKPIILLGISISAIASLCLTQVNEVHHFFFLRFAQGFFSAAPSVVLGALLRDLFAKNQFAKMMSLVMLVSTLAPLLAPIVGGYIVITFHWHVIFYVLAFIGVIATILITFYIPETLAKTNRTPLHLKNITRNFINAFRQREILGYILCGTFSFAGMFSFLTSGSIVYIGIYGIRVDHFGYFFLLNMSVMICFNLLNSRIVTKVGAEKMLQFGLILQLMAGLWLLIVAIFQLSFWSMALGVAAYVGMISIIGGNSLASTLDRFPQSAGTVASLSGTVKFGVGSLVGALISLVSITTALPMLLSMAICIIIGVCCYYFLTYRSLKNKTS